MCMKEIQTEQNLAEIKWLGKDTGTYVANSPYSKRIY